MNRQKVQFVALSEHRLRFDNTEAFQLRKDRRGIWLQKACFYVLRKLGAFQNSEKVTISRHEIDADTFMERLFRQQDNLRYMFCRQPDTLLIGSEDYANMMRDRVCDSPFAFNARYYLQNRNGGREICGLKVQVIPWMKGILVMPKDCG